MSNMSIGSSPSHDYVLSQLNKPAEKAHVISPEQYKEYARAKYAANGESVSDEYLEYEINFPLNNPGGGAQLTPGEWKAQFEGIGASETSNDSNKKTFSFDGEVSSTQSIIEVLNQKERSKKEINADVMKFKIDNSYLTEGL